MNDSLCVFPTSFAQQRLWFLDRLIPGSSFYNIHTTIPLEFDVDARVFEDAVNEIVRRHENLRTAFSERAGVPVQVVQPKLDVPLERIDLSERPNVETNQEVLAIATAEAQKPFDLATGPLLRTTLVTAGPRKHFFLLTIHHIVADAWSMGVFFRELGAIYKAFAAGEPSPLAELEIQYADFAVWQSEWLKGETLDREVDYWRQQLEGAPLLELPTDHPRPAVPSFRGAAHTFPIPNSLVRTLGDLARAEQSTLFMVMLAIFQVLLHRYTGQDDLTVGAPVANRNQTELEPLIGFFVNTLVIRTDISGDPTFRELVRRVREVTVDAYAHQDLPFEKLVEEIQPERDLSRNPLFQITFQLHNEPGVVVADSSPDRPDVPRATSNFDIAFDLWPSENGLTARLDYATDLFDPTTIERLGEHYRRLGVEAARDPDRRISELGILSATEARQLAEWNTTDRPFPAEATIDSLVREQALQSPEAVALVFGAETVTYAELERLADRLARHLAGRGLEPEEVVAVSLDRSTELIVALLGILKAGGAYLFLAPDEPADRRDRMLEVSHCRWCLSTTGRVASLDGSPTEIVPIDSLLRDEPDVTFPGKPTDRPPIPHGPDSLAYVAFTSGSTGTPKGVEVLHRGVTRLVRGIDDVELNSGQTLLQLAPVSFDASTFEIWGALANGARLVIAPPGALSLAEIAGVLDRHGVTTLWLTAGLFHQMVDGELEALARVSQVLAGGDVLSAIHVRKLLAANGSGRVVNGYGPTEGTTFTCCHVMARPEEVGDPVPIGRPIANTRVWVLDRHRRMVPPGVVGDLYIGGDGLARGYLGDAALTRERFATRLLESEHRVYRTGDRGRYRLDGTLEFRGRDDRQVKIRGYRVELAEIESALERCPEVAQVAVRAWFDPAGNKQLAAYIVPSGEALRPDAIGEFLRARLPDYMIPSRYLMLDALPLNANGKVDDARLPRPEKRRSRSEEHYVAPGTQVEIALAELFSDVLGIETIGLDDNFFTDLGGHSLLATQAVARICDDFDIEMPLRTLFETPTVGGLATVVEDILLTEIESLGNTEGVT